MPATSIPQRTFPTVLFMLCSCSHRLDSERAIFGLRRLVTAFFFREFGSGNRVCLSCRLHLKLTVRCCSAPIDKNAVWERQSGDRSPHSK